MFLLIYSTLMDSDTIKNRKRKREEEPAEAATGSAGSSLLVSPFQALKNFFLGGQPAPDNSESIQDAVRV